jgi:glycosyltransferase involved in cell wall biosynthesis
METMNGQTRGSAKTSKLQESVSFVLFVYNESALVGPAIRRITRALEKDFEDFELVLVDDGSSDDTGAIMKSLAAEDPRLLLVPNIVNLNIGISIQRGLAAATKEFTVYDGVDLPLAPEDVRSLVEQMHDCDVLLFDRKTFAGYTRWRWITSQINRMLLRGLFGVGWRDMNYSQMFRTSILDHIRCTGKSPAFTAPELILRARALGYRIKSVAVDYHARELGSGSLGRPHDIIWSTYDLLRFRLAIWPELKRSGPRAETDGRLED